MFAAMHIYVFFFFGVRHVPVVHRSHSTAYNVQKHRTPEPPGHESHSPSLLRVHRRGGDRGECSTVPPKKTWNPLPRHDLSGTAIGLPISWGGARGANVGIYDMAYME